MKCNSSVSVDFSREFPGSEEELELELRTNTLYSPLVSFHISHNVWELYCRFELNPSIHSERKLTFLCVYFCMLFEELL